MNIIIASDENYLAPAKVMLKSLNANTSENVEAYILHGGLDQEIQDDFCNQIAAFSDKMHIHFIEVESERFKDVPLCFDLPQTAYYRFLAPELLPDTIDRVLYLDCDIIINHSIDTFYHTNFGEAMLVACEDIGVSVTGKYEFLTIFGQLKKPLWNGKYFNSGVLLMDLVKAREKMHLQDVFDVIEKYREYIRFADQDILNFMYGPYTKYVDYKRYNMGAIYIEEADEDRVEKEAAIIHYYGSREDKPWLDLEKVQSEKLSTRIWWKYESQYVFSVITPCHNVNIILLNNAFESLKNQTCGFSNIEWIIVVHNCTEKNSQEIQDLVKGYSNIKVLHLKNDSHQASSPRNYGIDHATGTYIALLDADDYYNVEMLEKVRDNMVKVGAQVACFRYEAVVMGKDIPIDILPIVMVDQTQELLVFEHGKYDSSLLIHGEAMTVGCKVYNREFLNQYKIRFDDEIPYAEEGKFHLECYGHARKICYLPQLIGYYYCRYPDSMSSVMSKNSKEAYKYAYGFSKIFECGLSLGLDINVYMHDLMGYLSAILIMSVDVDTKTRKEITKMLMPYVKMLKPLEESKSYTAAKIKLINTLLHLVLCHPKIIGAAAGTMKLLHIDPTAKAKFNYDEG